ncbi:MAG TPA: hypothetical protein VD997_07820 [Phycisphaerales bacterium]|nr:hypothetical protein [Phycisphaerales bacterium]
MNRRTILCTAAVLTVVLGGCSSGRNNRASMGMVGPNDRVLSLAAGDSLGRAVYVNDVILAAAKVDTSSTFTNVDTTSTLSTPRE